jgi:hypothetical protein
MDFVDWEVIHISTLRTSPWINRLHDQQMIRRDGRYVLYTVHKVEIDLFLLKPRSVQPERLHELRGHKRHFLLAMLSKLQLLASQRQYCTCIVGNRSSAFICLPQSLNNHVDYHIIWKLYFKPCLMLECLAGKCETRLGPIMRPGWPSQFGRYRMTGIWWEPSLPFSPMLRA